MHVVCRKEQGILRTILERCTAEGFVVTASRKQEDEDGLDARKAVEMTLELESRQEPSRLVASLQEIPGIMSVRSSGTEDD